MKTIYNKLIRDRIPEIISQHGKKYSVSIIPRDKFLFALSSKLIEESTEVTEAISKNDRHETIKELADLLEVFETLIDILEIQMSEIQDIQLQRKKSRGGFSKRLWLEWVEE